MPGIALETPLATIAGIGPRFITHLDRMGITTVHDLLFHFPTRYEDYSQIYPIAELAAGQHATVQGTIGHVALRRSWRRRMTIVEAEIADATGEIRAVWFNQPYLKNTLRPGQEVNVSGKVTVSDNELFLSHPTHEVLTKKKTSATTHTGRLVPIYPETRGLTSKGIRFLMAALLKNLPPIPEFIPEEIRRTYSLPVIDAALQAVHFPEVIEASAEAKRRFAFQDLFLLQLVNLQAKHALKKEKALVVHTDLALMQHYVTHLPFEITVSQKKSLWEILQDLEKPHPMNRLLQGDVGSGKTVVAALAALATAHAGYQSVLMAPTEVLAGQHYATMKKLYAGMEAKLSEPQEKIRLPTLLLLTATHAKVFLEDGLEAIIKKPEAYKKIESGEAKIIIGTHALLEDAARPSTLGLVVVDEQHRFGVNQRAKLLRGQARTDEETGVNVKRIVNDTARLKDPQLSTSSQRSSASSPHFLSMSATPIPRTLMLTVFGDLDISLITQLPSGRKEIVTKIVAPENRKKAYDFIRTEVRKGRQVFVICPRIEPANADESVEGGNKRGSSSQGSAWSPRQSALLEVKSVKEEFEKLSTKIFSDLKVAMLHGQMKSKEKEAVMTDFKNNKSAILVATSVIEVGVDVQNATIMMIEGSERFGLAQLYQFRGRVGRGEHQSYCFLFTDSNAKSVGERLQAILEAKNGFELAEKDLAIRGPGEFLGQSQTGLPDLAMRNLHNAELVKATREAAQKILEENASLSNYGALKQHLKQFRKKIHLE